MDDEVRRLIEDARRLSELWHAGAYVSLARALAIANRLADLLERREHREAA